MRVWYFWFSRAKTAALRYPWSVPGKIQIQIRAGNCSPKEKGQRLLRSQRCRAPCSPPNLTTLIPSLSIGGFLLLTPGYPQGCVHPPVPSQGWFLLGSVPRAELRHKPFVQGTFVVTGTPSSAGPETWAFCKWCPNSPGCSFSPDSEPLASLDLEIQF